jgi:hypothetical protein
MIINVRSPYIIEIDEPTQIATRIQIYVSYGDNAQPALPQHVLRKNIPSPTQIETQFNISPYLTDYFLTKAPVLTTVVDKDLTEVFLNVWVETEFSADGINFTLIDTLEFTALYGKTGYLGGANQTQTTAENVLPLKSETQTIYIDKTKPSGFIHLFFDFLTFTDDVYFNDGSTMIDLQSAYGGERGVLKLPYFTSGNPDNATLEILDSAFRKVFSFQVKHICEPKYETKLCSFINRYGGFEYITFFKASQSNISTTEKTFKRMPSNVFNYVGEHQTSIFNKTGKESIKMNTGFVDENYSDLIQDLMLSETVFIDGVPVVVKSQTQTLKESINENNINYEIEFEYAFSLINDVI